MAIEIGSQNTRGPQGAQGPQGPQGPPGKDGTRWHSEPGEPVSTLGVNGDYYLDSLTGDFYEKENNKWVYSGNLKGPKGAKGEKGERGQTGVVYSQGASSGTSDFTHLTGVIAAGTTVNVHTVAMVNLKSLKYFCDVRNDDVERYCELQVLKTSSGLLDSLSARKGTGLFNFVVSQSGADMIFSVTNNNAAQVNYSIKVLDI